MIRVFFGIPITLPIVDRLLHESEQLRSNPDFHLRWIAPSLMHITVKFIAAVSPDILARLADRAGELVSGIHRFNVLLTKIGGFPRPQAKVLAAYIKPHQQLLTLHQALDRAGETMGIQSELRRYRPHITLAKFRSIPNAIAPHFCTHFYVPVSELILYESRLIVGGSEYIPLQRFKLLE